MNSQPDTPHSPSAPLHLGVAWYPEHWPRERWDVDLKMMKELGFTVVRVAEFAWSTIEVAPGRLELGWLQDAIDLAHAYGLSVVVGTPTTCPPAWLTSAHPDILPVRENGRVHVHGERAHYDPVNSVYREHSARIARILAEAFGKHPAVIGWQVGNEHWSVGFGPASLKAFQEWLKKRYGSLDALNTAWSTRYWSQEYFAWEDICFPLDYANPGLLLARHRWSSDETAEFQRLQIAAMRPYLPEGRWITHNFHPHDWLDRAVLSRDLDFPSWDAYPDAAGDGRHDPWADGLDCDRIRGLGDGRLWIMETQPGNVSWHKLSRHLAPGQTRAMAWHFVGHGADAVLYWQWRSAISNPEQYHGAVCDPSGQLRPVGEEIRHLGAEFARLGPLLAGSRIQSPVAVLDPWPDRVLFGKAPAMRLNRDYDARAHTLTHHAALRRAGCDVDVLDRIRPQELATHTVLIAPRWHHLDADDAHLVAAWVRNGGHLLIGARSGHKNLEGAFHLDRGPGPALRELLGGCVRDGYALATPQPLTGRICGAGILVGERLQAEAEDCEVLATWQGDEGWLEGMPAILSRRAGKGRITCCGAIPDEALADTLIAYILGEAGIHAWRPPAGVEASHRHGPQGSIRLLINTAAEPVVIPADPGWCDPLDGTTDAQSLSPWGVAFRLRR